MCWLPGLASGCPLTRGKTDSHPMRITKLHLNPAAVAVLFLLTAAFGQVPSEESLINELKGLGEFTEDDIVALEDGDPVVRELKTLDEQEVAFIGVIKLPYAYAVALEGFKRAVEKQRSGSAEAFGTFRDPPSAIDMATLAFDEDEILDLANCRIGDCDWNLSEELIRAFGSGVDWRSNGAVDLASNRVKQSLAAYVNRYMRNGDDALMVYRDTGTPVSLAAQYRSLVAKLFWLDRHAPEFAAYARGYPAVPLEGVENTFVWSKIKVGLKEVLMITHTMEFDNRALGQDQSLSLSKQIYANHYFNSSLGLTVLIGSQGKESGRASYLVFLNRSRASALGGILDGLLRKVIEDQAGGKLGDFLADARRYSALAAANRKSAAEREAFLEEQRSRAKMRNLLWIAIPAFAVLLAAVLFLLRRKRAG